MNDDGIKTDEKPIRDEKGLFVEGTKPGPGRPEGQKNYLTLMEEALEKQAIKEKVSYYDKLAEWCFRYPQTAIAILKKFIPDKTQNEILTPEGIKFIVERATEQPLENTDDNKENTDNTNL